MGSQPPWTQIALKLMIRWLYIYGGGSSGVGGGSGSGRILDPVQGRAEEEAEAS